jgi:signal transduction histidine kinase
MSSPSKETPLTKERILAAIEDIYGSRGSAPIEENILKVLADVFGFDYLMLARKVMREGEVWFEGICCGANCPEELVKDTKRKCTPGDLSEDILCYVARSHTIVRVDPLDRNDPLLAKLEPQTLKKFEYSDFIYFIPLQDRSGETLAIIHASRPRANDCGNDSEFRTALTILSKNAGLAFENAELYRKLDRMVQQRQLVAEIGATWGHLGSLEEKLDLMLTAVTCGTGLRYNRALLFLRNNAGQYTGIRGIAPENVFDFRRIAKITDEWRWQEYSAVVEHVSSQSWPNDLLRQLSLPPLPGTPLFDAINAMEVRIFSGTEAIHPAVTTEPFDSLFANSGPYALVPIKGTTSSIGVLYLDNAFSREEISDTAGLGLLSLQLSSLLEGSKRLAQEKAIKTAFATLLQRFGTVTEGSEAPRLALYKTIHEAAKTLGGLRSCVATVDALTNEWQIVDSSHDSPSVENPWKDALTALSLVHSADGMAHTYPVQREDGDQVVVVAFVPFAFDSEHYAICMELNQVLDVDLAFSQAWGTLAVFTSAVLAFTERAELQEGHFSEFFENNRKIFATNLYRVTAHEARNVLSSLLIVVEGINSGASKISHREKQEFRELEARINAGVEALDTYVKYLSGFGAGKAASNQWTDLRRVAKEVIVLLSPRIARTGKLAQQVFAMRVEPIDVMMDHTDLTIVLHNLISNAIKATKDVALPAIDISAQLTESGKAQIRITDNGCGIRADERDKLFKAGYSGFAKRPTADSQIGSATEKSSGIGLFGCNLIVTREYRGSLQLNSSGGRTEALLTLKGRRSK